MEYVIKGHVHTFGKNIDTDQIYPAKHLDIVDIKEIAKHCMEGADPSFASEVKPGDIITAGTNFGCGSSREHAVITLVHAGVVAVVAESFARIFYRNAINLALPLLVCPGISKAVQTGDKIKLDIKEGIVKIMTSGKKLTAEKLSDHALRILESGGIKELFKKKHSYPPEK